MAHLELALDLGRGQLGQRLGEALFHAVQAGDGFVVRVGGLAAGHVGGDHQPDLLAHMVEGQHLVEEEQAGVGHAQFVLGQLRQPLDLADGIVGEKAHGSGGEGRQALQPRGLVAAERAAQHGEDVALDLDDLLALGDGNLAAARHDALEGREADEGVAAHLLAVLHRLQHEALALRPGGAQKGRDRRLQVGGERAADGNKRVLFGERQELLAAGLDGLGGGFHKLSVIARRGLPSIRVQSANGWKAVDGRITFRFRSDFHRAWCAADRIS